MKLYSYIVKHDTGFAPNPFWGYCTLAACKPAIRRTAKAGDWIVGLSTKASCNRIIYVMRVDEALSGVIMPEISFLHRETRNSVISLLERFGFGAQEALVAVGFSFAR